MANDKIKKLEQVIVEASLALREEGYFFAKADKRRFYYCMVDQVQVEWHYGYNCLALGYGLKQADKKLLASMIAQEIPDAQLKIESAIFYSFGRDITIFDLTQLLDLIKRALPLLSTGEDLKGASFEGTPYERMKERGATIGGKFGRMVCNASGMNPDEMYAEEYYSMGEIDGVEKDTVGRPISVYECQSGIHNGSYLDDHHLSKALLFYPYDPAIIPTLKKIVILAGGYTKKSLSIVRQRADELGLRLQPIEVILLQTEKKDNTIIINRVQY